MSLPRQPFRRRPPTRPAAAARLCAVLGAVAVTTVGLSACRSIGPGSEVARAGGDPPGPTVTTPVAAPTTPVAESTPDPSERLDPPTTPPLARAETRASTTTVSGTSGTGDAPQPPKTVVDDPWQIVGRPFLLDVDGADATATGVTNYRLYFRTRGDFRGVRAGTATADPRHYKVGLIDVPDLPAYVPGGADNFALADRRENDGRYCWAGTLAKPGNPAATDFPIRGAGVALAVSFDLHGAAVQNRTAPVVIQGSSSTLLPQEKALGCHIEDFPKA